MHLVKDTYFDHIRDPDPFMTNAQDSDPVRAVVQYPAKNSIWIKKDLILYLISIRNQVQCIQNLCIDKYRIDILNYNPAADPIKYITSFA